MVEVVLPEVQRQPRPAHWPHTPGCTINGRGGAPKIGVVMCDPTVRAVVNLGSVAASLGQLLNQAEQGLLAFG